MEATKSDTEKSPGEEETKTPHGKSRESDHQTDKGSSLGAQPRQKADGFVKVGDDNRFHFQKTDERPNSVHGVVSMDINNIRYWGTGIMIGPDTVLTAGHNLYDFKEKTYANHDTMQFSPGMNGQKAPFGPVDVVDFCVSPNYIIEGKEDYGILILRKSIGEKTGYFRLSRLGPDELESKEVTVKGYPADKVASSSTKTFELWGGTSKVSYIDKDEGLIHYMIDTAPGQSGSGVYYREGEHFYICGVHIHGGPTINRGTLITKAISEQIDAWQRKFSKSKLKNQGIWNSELGQGDINSDQ